MMNHAKYYIPTVFISVFAAVVLAPFFAEASALLACSAGVPVANTSLFDDTLICQNSNGLQTVFSNVICEFVTILNYILGRVYCGMFVSLQPIFRGMITLYVAVFGAQILMGTAQLNARDILIRLFKIALVWMFFTDSTWAIQFVFLFFMGFVTDATSWVIGLILPFTANPGSGMPEVFVAMDALVYSVITGTILNNNSQLVAFFVLMMTAAPPLFSLASYWLLSTALLLARTLISFLLGVSAIAFLVSLTPIFISCVMFQFTQQLFENWLKYLISYALQIVIVFTILIMWIASMQMFGGFFSQLDTMIVPYKKGWAEGAPLADPVSSVALCKHSVSWQNYVANATMNIPIYRPMASCTSYAADDLIPASKVPEQGPFLIFVIFNLITMLIVTYAYSRIMNDAYGIARQLAGTPHIPHIHSGLGMEGVGEMLKGGPSKGKVGAGGVSNKSTFGRYGMDLGSVREGAKNAFVDTFSKQMEARRKLTGK